MKCPIHKVNLVCKKTRYGCRHSCPIDSCTVACWGNETSTPADAETRQKRHDTHLIFDNWWRKQDVKRQVAYKKLAHHLGLEIKDTHIGHFNIEQCKKVIEFVEGKK